MKHSASVVAAGLWSIVLTGGIVVGGAYAQAASLTQYEELFKGMLQQAEETFGPESVEAARSLETLALLYMGQQQYVAAEPLFHRALAIREKALGMDHFSNASTLEHLGNLYQRQGKPIEAERAYKRSIEIERKVAARGVGLPRVLRNLADLYKNQGRYNEAGTLYQESLAIAEANWGRKSMGIASGLLAFARFQETVGQYEAAEPMFLRVAEIYDSAARGVAPAKLAEVYGSVALFYERLGRKDDAAKFADKAKQALKPRN
jgi:tetratricopeptide (TPR) repeat protein